MGTASPDSPAASHEQFATTIDHILLQPEIGDEEVIAGCRLAARYGVASVIVRPSDVELALGVLGSTGVRVGSVAGFPHGWETTPAKLYQVRDLLRRGAQEIEVVVNVGKLRSRQFQYVEMELLQLAEACHERNAVLKAVVDTAHLGKDLQIIACKLAKRTCVDFVAVCRGTAAPGPEILRLAAAQCLPRAQLKAGGDLETLEQVLEAQAIGCTRIGTTRTSEILESWKHRMKESQKGSTP